MDDQDIDDQDMDIGQDDDQQDPEELDEQPQYEVDGEQVEVRTDLPEDQQDQPRVTSRYMTKYERARVLGVRALQVSMNAPVMVELDGQTDPLEIAQMELAQKKIPFTIRRYMPDGSYEDWSVSELEIPDR